jgi:hypothetical protein
MSRRTTNRYAVKDKHTGETVKRYVRERDARWAADKLCGMWGKGRYIVATL